MKPTVGQRLRRLRPLPVASLTLVWVLLWGTWSLGNILNGLLLAVLALVLLPLPEVSSGAKLHAGGLARFVGGFVTDLVVSSAQVAWQAVRPGPQDISSIVAVALRSDSELIMTLTVEALSLVPGSIVLELDRPSRTLYAHVLSAPDQGAVDAFRQRVLDVEERIIRAVGTTSELALLDHIAERTPT